MMDLKETLSLMTSEDYKERFKAEYYQTKIRYEKLRMFNTKIEAAHATDCCGPIGTPDRKRIEMPKHDCPDYMLKEQERVMSEYLHILEVRAIIEGIEL